MGGQGEARVPCQGWLGATTTGGRALSELPANLSSLPASVTRAAARAASVLREVDSFNELRRLAEAREDASTEGIVQDSFDRRISEQRDRG